MSYEAVRRATIEAQIDKGIARYARQFKPGQPTVVLLPGGMGSQLFRSKTRFHGRQVDPMTRFKRIWFRVIDLKSYLHQMRIGPAGWDQGARIITTKPNGTVSNIFTDPYDRIEEFFDAQGWNYIECCYDWRRPMTEGAGYLAYFLRKYREMAETQGDEYAPQRLALVGHSMGGLIATLFLHDLNDNGEDPGKWFCALFSVASSYYGTSRSMERLYEGVPYLAILSGGDRRYVAEIVGTMPGAYPILYVDQATYQRDQAALAADATFPLANYPMHDAQGGVADPYSGMLTSRYPGWVAGSGHLGPAQAERYRLTARIADSFHARMFHIRSGLISMPTEQRWDNVDGSLYNPNATPPPVGTVLTGPGDNRVPAWSARHVHTPGANVYDAQTAASHMELIRFEEVRHFIRDKLIECGADQGVPVTTSQTDYREPPDHEEKATPEELESFLRRVATGLVPPGHDDFARPYYSLPFFEEVMW